MRKEIAAAIRRELWRMDFSGGLQLWEIQDKDGVIVCRVRAGGRRYVLKYFEKEEYRREIRNYQILSFAEIPTVTVYSYTARSIIMEDLQCSPAFRLGREADMADPSVAALLARWYRQLHARGAEAADLPSLWREDECLTAGTLQTLRERLGPFPGEDALRGMLPRLRAALDGLPQTLTYNDFHWTNFAVARDGSSAFLFDYNLLGRGYRYADLRNVTSFLSAEAGAAFLREYGPVPERERLADNVASPLVTLANACRRETFPAWAEASLAELRGGAVERALHELLG